MIVPTEYKWEIGHHFALLLFMKSGCLELIIVSAYQYRLHFAIFRGNRGGLNLILLQGADPVQRRQNAFLENMLIIG